MRKSEINCCSDSRDFWRNATQPALNSQVDDCYTVKHLNITWMCGLSELHIWWKNITLTPHMLQRTKLLLLSRARNFNRVFPDILSFILLTLFCTEKQNFTKTKNYQSPTHKLMLTVIRVSLLLDNSLQSSIIVFNKSYTRLLSICCPFKSLAPPDSMVWHEPWSLVHLKDF